MAFDIQTWISVAAFSGGGLAMGLGAIGAALGEGNAAQAANAAVARNPEMSGDIFKTLLVNHQNTLSSTPQGSFPLASLRPPSGEPGR